MTEFTKEDIEYYRKQYALWTSRRQTTPEELHLIGRLRDALDEIERLQQRIAELEQERRWISIEEANLEVWKKYIVLLKNKEGKTYSGLAQYFPSKTVLEEDFISDECYEEESITEYDEENDCYWVREGWFEHTIEGEMEYRLSDEVIMVMPLPKPPKEGE